MEHSEHGGHGGHGGHGMEKETLMVIHGALMLIGWCVLLPLGIMASIFRARLNGEYCLHVVCASGRRGKRPRAQAERVWPDTTWVCLLVGPRRRQRRCRRASIVAELA